MARVLFQVVLSPRLSAPATRGWGSAVSPAVNQHTRRHLSSSKVLRVVAPVQTTRRDPKFRAVARKPRDTEIKHPKLRLLHPETNEPQAQPTSRFQALRSYDPRTHFLEQVTPDKPNDPNFIPVCRIVSKRDAYEEEKASKQAAKATKKAEAKTGAAGMKTIELNWAISTGDLGHRLDKIKDFLLEGRHVEVILAKKKGGRRATVEECEALLARIHEAVESVPRAREVKKRGTENAPPPRLGAFMALKFAVPKEEKKREARSRSEGQAGEIESKDQEHTEEHAAETDSGPQERPAVSAGGPAAAPAASSA